MQGRTTGAHSAQKIHQNPDQTRGGCCELSPPVSTAFLPRFPTTERPTLCTKYSRNPSPVRVCACACACLPYLLYCDSSHAIQGNVGQMRGCFLYSNTLALKTTKVYRDACRMQSRQHFPFPIPPELNDSQPHAQADTMQYRSHACPNSAHRALQGACASI